MRKTVIAVLLGTAALTAPLAANASVIGQSISGVLSTNQGAVAVQFTSPAVVGQGTEFVGSFYDVFQQHWDFTVDVGADTIILGVHGTDDQSNAASLNIAGVTLTGFTGLGAMNLLSYSCTGWALYCNASQPSINSLQSNSSSFALSLNHIQDGETYVFGSAVPEPAAWALMIAGFGLTGAALRRRRIALAV